MYGQSVSHSDGYNKMVKPSVHHLSSTRNSSSNIKEVKNSEILQKQNSTEKNSLSRSSSHSSKSSHENKHYKVQGALRTCGIWSEHRSSSGKIYFYNNVSEISQWEKPKEWDDITAVDTKSKHPIKPSSQKNTVKSSSSRHSSTSKNTSTSNSGGEVDRDYRHHKDFCDRDYRNRFSAGDRDYKDIDYRNTGAISKPYKNNNIKRSISSDKDYRSLNTSTNASHAVTNHMNTGNVPSKKDNYVPSTGKFYDYSSWNSTSNSHKDTKNVNGTTADSSKKTSEGGDNASNSKKLSATSEFVRKLSSVLNQAASTSGSNSVKSEENIKDVFQLLLNVASKNRAESDSAVSNSAKHEASESSTESNQAPPEKKSRPTQDEPSSTVNNSSRVEQTSEEEEFKCLNQFQSVFDPSLITHVQNWPAEHNEKQCTRLAEDFHRFVADEMSTVTVKLTNSRSKVRTSEILSTVHEQRILYIRQQISDLEKSSSSSSSSSTPFT